MLSWAQAGVVVHGRPLIRCAGNDPAPAAAPRLASPTERLGPLIGLVDVSRPLLSAASPQAARLRRLQSGHLFCSCPALHQGMEECRRWRTRH